MIFFAIFTRLDVRDDFSRILTLLDVLGVLRALTRHDVLNSREASQCNHSDHLRKCLEQPCTKMLQQ